MMRTRETPDDQSTACSPAVDSNGIDCCKDSIARLRSRFLDFQSGDIVAGRPVLRPVFDKQHGCVTGIFKVHSDIPKDLKVGVFSHKKFPVWVRFSSDVRPTEPDLLSRIGIAIKLFGVPGRKILDGDEEAMTHDFILQNHDIFFADNAEEMCSVMCSGPASVPGAEQILNEMGKQESSVLLAQYWSIVPYAFGHGKYVKYLLKPCWQNASRSFDPATADRDYLRRDLHERMLVEGGVFDFYLQLRTENMPLDRATVRWEESASEPILVAKIYLSAGQNIESGGTSEYGRSLSFNPWRVLPEHTPIGSINEARRVVYAATAKVRRNLNGIPIVEPRTPRSS